MKQRLPSLLAIRYFESVGRNLSFTLAANELNVTQAAVSHQIRLLEQELNTKLFDRHHQRIELTKSGADLLDVTIECFSKLSDVTNRISIGKRTSRIHMSVPPLFSTHILMPNLGEFISEDEDIEIVLHHSLAPPNEKDAPYDLRLFFSRTPIRHESCELVLEDRLIPMCASAVQRNNANRPIIEFLMSSNIVHEFDYEWWGEWCNQLDVDKEIVRKGLVLDDPSVLENAALLGRGLILGSMRFLGHRIESGELVAPFGTEDGINIYYYLMTGRTQKRREVSRILKWIKANCQAIPSLTERPAKEL